MNINDAGADARSQQLPLRALEADTWHLAAFADSLHDVRPATLQGYVSDVRHFIGWCTTQRVPAPSYADRSVVRSYLASMSDARYAAATIQRHAASLRRYFAVLTEHRHVTTNPTDGVRVDAPRAAPPAVPSAADMETLLGSGVPHPSPRLARDQLCLNLLYGSALRANELCQLDRDEVSGRATTLNVEGKGGKRRVVPTCDVSQRLLLAWTTTGSDTFDRVVLSVHARATRDADALFVNLRGKRLTTRDLHRLVIAWAPRLRNSMLLRHAAATHMLEGSDDLMLVRDLLGHQKASNTQVYTHVAQARLRDVVARTHPRG